MSSAHFPIRARCPKTGGEIVVKLSPNLIKRIRDNGPPVRLHDIVGDGSVGPEGSPVQEILLHPSHIFGDIRAHQEGGTCYCGVPSCSYTDGGCKCPPKPNMVYCVYVNPGGVFFESGWEPADTETPELPLGWRTRYKVKLWPKH